jgi:glutathione peroxidase
MKKKNNYFIIILIIVFNLLIFNIIGNSMENKTFYDFELELITGETISLDKYEGKAVLLVNVASKCGFTKQYTDLQNLWEKYREKNLIVLGVPSNQFGSQEPGSNDEIKDFCETNFNINFPMTSKYDVKGENAHDVYKWAKDTFGKSAVPKWNFHKILIDKNGKIHDTFASFTNPMSKKIIKELENIL